MLRPEDPARKGRREGDNGGTTSIKEVEGKKGQFIN